MAGPIYLHNFKPKAMHERIRVRISTPKAEHGGHRLHERRWLPKLVPWDLAKIYNITPLFTAGISGQGMKIMVVEDTNQWNCNPSNQLGGMQLQTSDFAIFRNTFGLGKYPSGMMNENNPGNHNDQHCTGPVNGSWYPAGSGINSDDVEASIDVEWASAAAPTQRWSTQRAPIHAADLAA